MHFIEGTGFTIIVVVVDAAVLERRDQRFELESRVVREEL